MSPEQARGQQVDHRPDIWALGCVLYEMAAGRSPFAGQSSSDTLAAILDREPPPLARFEPDAPPELQRVIVKTLKKDRAQRYQTTQDLLLDLQALREKVHAHTRSDSSSSRRATPSDSAGTDFPRRSAEVSSCTGSPGARRGQCLLRCESDGVRNLWQVSVDPETLGWTAADRLTTGAGQDSSPTLSADGTRLVFTVRNESTRIFAYPFDAAAGRIVAVVELLLGTKSAAFD